MGDWDLYCALCATKTGGGVEGHLGSTNPVMLDIRHRAILALKQKVESGEETNPYPSFDEEDAEDVDLSEINWDWDDESCAYDPTLLCQEDTEWQRDVCCLGLNIETNQAYISGPAGHTDHGRVRIQRGTDPNEPVWQYDDEPHTYWTLDEGDSVLFPIHKTCLGILHSVLRAPGAADVDKKALYEALCLLSTMFQAHLTIEYGNFQGNMVDWECIPGEEYVVMRPAFSSDAKATIRDNISSGGLRPRQHLIFDISERIVSDPFRSLPTELLCDVASYLCLADLKALSVASWHVMNTTSGNTFWKSVLYRETEWMGLDLDEILLGLPQENVDYKALSLWLEKMTRPRFAVDAPWLGAANRRRIWNACEQIAGAYWGRERQRIKKAL